MQNQGNDKYGELEPEFDKIPQTLKFTGLSALDEHIGEMFYMACYDLDRFRRYVFEGSFLSIFGVDKDTARQIKDDDPALLQFGFHWLARNFDLRKSMEVRDEVFGIEQRG